MRKPDEIALMRHTLAADGRCYDLMLALERGDELFIAERRALAILGKWYRRGWWEFGVSMRSGWLTPDGVAALTAIVQTEYA